MRERAVRETERRLAGDVLAEALGGNLGAEELRGRLQPFGIDGRVAVLLFELEESADDPMLLAEALAAPALVAVNAAAGRPLLCAIVDPGDRDPIELAREGRAALGGIRPAGPRRRQPSDPGRLVAARRSTRRAARSRRPRWPTATPRTSRRTATSARSRCCSRSRTTMRCAPTPRTCSPRSRRARASTGPSCCARWRRSSSATASGSARPAISTATGTRCATGSAGSRS